jgi:hypothetical protein
MLRVLSFNVLPTCDVGCYVERGAGRRALDVGCCTQHGSLHESLGYCVGGKREEGS